MKLYDLIKDIQVKNIINDANPEVAGMHYNSAKIGKGDLFVAIKGFKTDGHKYIADAEKRGACAVICEEYDENVKIPQITVENSRIAEAQIAGAFFDNPSKSFKLIGITGTNGKTTCTYLVKQILEFCGYKTGLIGTNQNMIGDKVFETGRTTPDAFELQELFAKMREEAVDYVIMEVSSHALDLNRVYGCNFKVSAFTNLTQDHLDFHGTMENYAQAKSKIYAMSECAVINTDDPYGKKMASDAPCRVMTYSVDGDTCLSAVNLKMTSKGIEFDTAESKYFLAIPGKFSVYNALCAIGVCKSLGIDEKTICDALKTASGVKGRAEIVPCNGDYTVMIDYAHTPDGIENILNTVKGFAKGRVVIVFGCGGDRDNTKRPVMGEIAARLADYVIVTSDNPRGEEPIKIIDMIVEGVKKHSTPYTVIENRKQAIEYAVKNAKCDDVIVLAGKGHETYQVLKDKTIHFDEREIVSEILNN